MSLANAEAAGVADWIHVEKRALSDVQRPPAEYRPRRRKPALWRAHRRRIGSIRIVHAARCPAARALQGLESRNTHGQSADGAPPRDLCETQPSRFQWNDRMPAAALRPRCTPRATCPASRARRVGGATRRADVRESSRQESRQAGTLGAARRHRVLSGLRRGHAGVRVRDRSVRTRAAPRLRAGICCTEDRQQGRRTRAPPGAARGAARRPGRSAGADPHAVAQAAEGQRTIRKTRDDE